LPLTTPFFGAGWHAEREGKTMCRETILGCCGSEEVKEVHGAFLGGREENREHIHLGGRITGSKEGAAEMKGGGVCTQGLFPCNKN